MAGLIPEDYSAFSLLGGAAQGFAKGMMDAEDRADRQEDKRMKKLEIEAKMRADQSDRERRDRERKEDIDYRERKLEAERGSGFGKAPPGYRFRPDGGLEAIPGGPAEIKPEKKATSDRYSEVALQDADRVLEEVTKNPGWFGPTAGQAAKLPMDSPARRASDLLTSVKAAASFDRLQAMRASSPTGAGLGAVSDSEMKLLQSTAGALDATLPPKILEANLKRFINMTNDVIHGPGKGPPRYEINFKQNMSRPKGGLLGKPQGLVPEESAQEDKDLQRLEELRRKAAGG